ncbi:MAG: hypothetical protein ACLQQ4_14450 [Bacteroidia bacterium]
MEVNTDENKFNERGEKKTYFKEVSCINLCEGLSYLSLQFKNSKLAMFFENSDTDNIKVFEYTTDSDYCWNNTGTIDAISKEKEFKLLESNIKIEQIEFTIENIKIITTHSQYIFSGSDFYWSSLEIIGLCQNYFGADIIKAGPRVTTYLEEKIRAKRLKEADDDAEETNVIPEKKTNKFYKWENVNMSVSDVDEDGEIWFHIFSGEHLERSIAFQCSDTNKGPIKEKIPKDAECDDFDVEILEEDAEIKLIEFKSHLINIRTRTSIYAFRHTYVGGGNLMESCKSYFPSHIISIDPQLQTEISDWSARLKRNDEEEAAEDREEIREMRSKKDDYSFGSDFFAQREKEESELNTSKNKSLSSKAEFTSSVTRGGDVINPDKIIIDAGIVTWKKRSKILISGESVSIPIDKVSSVDLSTGVVGTDILISSYGNKSIHAKDFTKSDAQKIKNLLGF